MHPSGSMAVIASVPEEESQRVERRLRSAKISTPPPTRSIVPGSGVARVLTGTSVPVMGSRKNSSTVAGGGAIGSPTFLSNGGSGDKYVEPGVNGKNGESGDNRGSCGNV